MLHAEWTTLSEIVDDDIIDDDNDDVDRMGSFCADGDDDTWKVHPTKYDVHEVRHDR